MRGTVTSVATCPRQMRAIAGTPQPSSAILLERKRIRIFEFKEHINMNRLHVSLVLAALLSSPRMAQTTAGQISGHVKSLSPEHPPGIVFAYEGSDADKASACVQQGAIDTCLPFSAGIEIRIDAKGGYAFPKLNAGKRYFILVCGSEMRSQLAGSWITIPSNGHGHLDLVYGPKPAPNTDGPQSAAATHPAGSQITNRPHCPPGATSCANAAEIISR